MSPLRKQGGRDGTRGKRHNTDQGGGPDTAHVGNIAGKAHLSQFVFEWSEQFEGMLEYSNQCLKRHQLPDLSGVIQNYFFRMSWKQKANYNPRSQ